MANVPPLFGDLGKSARDVFDKSFGEFVTREGEIG